MTEAKYLKATKIVRTLTKRQLIGLRGYISKLLDKKDNTDKSFNIGAYIDETADFDD